MSKKSVTQNGEVWLGVPDTQPMFLNAKEAATITGLTSRTIVRMCGNGELPAVKIGNSWRINREKFMQLIGLED